MRSFSKRTMTVAATAVAVTTVGGIAIAYYTAGVAGTGAGSATTAANTAAAVTYAASEVTGLLPGGSGVATVTVTNPNTYAVSYTAKTITVSGITTNGLCTSAKALLSGSATMPANTLAGSATTTFPLTISMADSTTVDQSDCAGKTLVVNLATS